ncbi:MULTISPECIES: hypothetical protein [Citrobacter]|uniref:hypothetical protein n=1 Tax=Citrobacter TaxID=544 RepID=UPI001BA01569|nr:MULTISPECIES: hypothetical protein [unclassified Citrobacter]MCS8550799.1 hypothetical protein [Citrobacter sp. XY323]MDM3386578.1 hypothetical protein [Citrobacter sp. Cb011]HBC8787304.1 hypothetical protein [Citrobacter braakii]HBV7423473.1 hypothetical protein [Citrobacter freundii]
MKWILTMVLVMPISTSLAENIDSIDYKKTTESVCFEPSDRAKQDLCEKIVKSMLLNAVSVGYSEAACTAKIIKDKQRCKKDNQEYQELMRYSMP